MSPGSTRGLGLAIARGLAEAGAEVIVNGRTRVAVEAAAAGLAEAGHKVRQAEFDVTDSDQVGEQVGRLGHIDILVNNAGVQHRAPVEDFPDDAWERVLETNLTGPFRVTRAVLPGMYAAGHGKIINIGSLMSDLGRASIVPYAAAKGGVRMLTRGLCAECTGRNVQVNAICPGYFATEMNTALIEDEKFDTWVRTRTPAGRWGDPRELIGAAVFLSSSASDFISGQMIFVDGGLSATV